MGKSYRQKSRWKTSKMCQDKSKQMKSLLGIKEQLGVELTASLCGHLRGGVKGALFHPKHKTFV